MSASSSEGIRIDLPAVLDAAAAVALADRFRAALDGSGPILVDGAAVTRCTTPAIQVLLAADRAAAARGRAIACPNRSDILTRAFTDLGLSAEWATFGDH